MGRWNYRKGRVKGIERRIEIEKGRGNKNAKEMEIENEIGKKKVIA
ncbi:hypothetical protein CCACVL1_30559 [Corchorus capsularis]|uniref:Uncharacterized protein n=1 Tax=Corchorus capsularis TaxID=210143 RepID=A0A1R3FWV7_COCAP|nr:hypothetical protein CCACVL1_30559 [Corchorus capsularis]